MFILLLIAVSICIGQYFYYNNIVYKQKKKSMLLSKYNNELTLKYKNISNNIPIDITFSLPNSSVAFTKDICKLRLAPIDDMPLIYIINSPTKVKIIDIGEINDEKWFFIFINLPNNCYKKGWVHENEIKFLIE